MHLTIDRGGVDLGEGVQMDGWIFRRKDTPKKGERNVERKPYWDQLVRPWARNRTEHGDNVHRSRFVQTDPPLLSFLPGLKTYGCSLPMMQRWMAIHAIYAFFPPGASGLVDLNHLLRFAWFGVSQPQKLWMLSDHGWNQN